jgi:hypothetical protein
LERFKNNDGIDLLNRTITVTGIITSMEMQSITIDSKVHCSFVNEIQEIENGANIVIKGRCIGFDDLFEIVKLDQSSIIK